MKYDELAAFISSRMKMSHVYQPVMLLTLLRHDGKSSEHDIARAILEHDPSQVEYYRKITNNMVGRVLRNHNVVQKLRDQYLLLDFENLTESEISRLADLCEQRLKDYIDKRGRRIWSHRLKSSGYISGTKKYEVLKRSKFHCELCGVPADERALEVDHIVPRNMGGRDDISNMQALCYSCNAMKRDRDSTDFRLVRESFKKTGEDCIFCNVKIIRVLFENELAFAVQDGFPVTPLHSLVIPKRHVVSYFELGQSEVNACTQIINQLKDFIQQQDTLVLGFNIGVNNGKVAGQTISHCHIHLIPRRQGDVDNPLGGVRHIIPGKGYYVQS